MLSGYGFVVSVDDMGATCSVQQRVRRAAEIFGDRLAVGLPGRIQSFAQTYERALRLAAALENLGAQPGTRVALLASNGPWYFELHFAACEAGMVAVPVNARFTVAEQIRYLNLIAPEILLVTAEYAAVAVRLRHSVSSLNAVVGIGEAHDLPYDYERILAAAQPSERPLRDIDELVLISATSGTSGEAKAVQHTQRSTASAYNPLDRTLRDRSRRSFRYGPGHVLRHRVRGMDGELRRRRATDPDAYIFSWRLGRSRRACRRNPRLSWSQRRST